MSSISKHDNAMTKLQKAFPDLAELKKGVKGVEAKIGKGGGRSFSVQVQTKEGMQTVKFKMKHLLTHMANLVKKDVKTMKEDDNLVMEGEEDTPYIKAQEDIKSLPGLVKNVRRLDKEGFKKELSKETGPLQKILTSIRRFFGNIAFDKERGKLLHDIPSPSWPTKESVELKQKGREQISKEHILEVDQVQEDEKEKLI